MDRPEYSLLEIAQKYRAAGLNVLPADKKKKRPIGRWKEWTKSVGDFDSVFPKDLQFDALAVVCGATSGGLEVVDFDQKAKAFNDFANFYGSLDLFPVESTQSGGKHIAFRSSDFGRNQKLALDEKDEVLIETRGEGGICLIAPSDGYRIESGDWLNVPTLDPTERERLLNVARSLSQKKASSPILATAKPQKVASPRYGESVADYLRRDLSPVRDALIRAGWSPLFTDEKNDEYWARPNQPVANKPGGVLHLTDGWFHCFTSNGGVFKLDGNYTALQVIAAVDFGGDESAASKHWKRSKPRVIDCVSREEIEAAKAEPPKQKPKKAEPVEFPKSLLNCEGLIGEIMEVINERARRPQPEGAFLASLCATSYLCGRSIELYCDGATTTPNIYGLFLAPSGMGKEAPRRVASEIAQLYAPKESAPEAFASIQALQNMVSRVKKVFWLHDEFGRDLAVMNNERTNANTQGIITESLKLYSNANNRHYLPKLRAQEAVGAKRPDPVDRPFLTIFATGNPREFYASASDVLLHNGYIARFTIVAGRDYSAKIRKSYEERTAMRETEIPAALRQRVSQWLTYETVTKEKPQFIGFTREADSTILDYDDQIESQIRIECATDGTTELKARYAEKLWKYALLFGASKFGPRFFELDKDCAEKAVALVDYESRLFAANSERFATNDATRFTIEILDWARAIGGTFTKSQFTRKFQRRGTKRERDEALETLEDADYIVFENGLYSCND